MIGIQKKDKIVMIPKKNSILELSDEDMKEASRYIKEKGIKTSHLKKLCEMGVKFPTYEPHFPIQVHAICPAKVMKMYHLLLWSHMLLLQVNLLNNKILVNMILE